MDGVFYRGYYDEEDGDLYVYDLSCLSWGND